jgi:hypothetical protein
MSFAGLGLLLLCDLAEVGQHLGDAGVLEGVALLDVAVHLPALAALQHRGGRGQRAEPLAVQHGPGPRAVPVAHEQVLAPGAGLQGVQVQQLQLELVDLLLHLPQVLFCLQLAQQAVLERAGLRLQHLRHLKYDLVAARGLGKPGRAPGGPLPGFLPDPLLELCHLAVGHRPVPLDRAVLLAADSGPNNLPIQRQHLRKHQLRTLAHLADHNLAPNNPHLLSEHLLRPRPVLPVHPADLLPGEHHPRWAGGAHLCDGQRHCRRHD